MHIKGVKNAFKGFIYDYSVDGKEKNETINDLHRMLKLHYRSNAPRRPPRIIILGPPGSGRSTQCDSIAKRYGLIHISTRALLKNEIARN